MDNKEINLYKAFAKFIEEMRSFIPSELDDKYGEDSWEGKYCESLMQDQQEQWRRNLQEIEESRNLIDYGNLKSFVLNQKDFLGQYFTRRDVNNLPTMFNQMNEARNNLMHFLPFNEEKAQLAYLQMILVAEKLQMTELKEDLRKLKVDSFGA